MFIYLVLMHLSASQLCPAEYRCSSGTSIPPDITLSSGIDTRMLDLSCKLIPFLETDYFSEKNVMYLVTVRLNDNCIKSVQPEVFKPLVALRHLYLHNNQLSSLHPGSFQTNIHLITLDLSGNKLMQLDPNIFENNYNLSWVNIARNPLQISAVKPTMFTFSLNVIDIDTCNKSQNSINYFQQIPYLRQLNLKQNTMFTVKALMSYQNVKHQQMSLENDFMSKLIKLGYSDSNQLSYDAKQNTILFPPDTSLLCFCNRLSAWFWCLEEPVPCTSHRAGVLNCSVTSTSLAAAVSTPTVREATATPDDQTNLSTNTSTSNKHPVSETVDNFPSTIHLIVGAVIVIIIIIIVVVALIFAVRLCRKKNARERPVLYTLASQNAYDASSSTHYHIRRDSPDATRVSSTYAEPYDWRKGAAIRAPSSSSVARADNIRSSR